jgi:hypothetical protein
MNNDNIKQKQNGFFEEGWEMVDGTLNCWDADCDYTWEETRINTVEGDRLNTQVILIARCHESSRWHLQDW